MYDTRVALDAPVSVDYRAEIERRLFFLSADIIDFALTEYDGRIYEVVFTTTRPADAGGLGDKLAYIIQTDITGRGLPPKKVVWCTGERTAAYAQVYDQMLADGLAFETGEGQVALGGLLMALMDHFDQAITAIVRNRFAAAEFRYPTLIPTKVLDEIGYFSSFPQFLMFVTRLHSDTDVYRSVVADAESGKPADASMLARCDSLDYCLPPTMCFHTFHQFRGQRIPAGDNRVVTAKGKSFRFESRYARSLERLWDFTIREVVFLGDRDFVERARTDLMADIFHYFEALGISGYCEVANDPFFCNSDTSGKVIAQRLLELKYEARADIGDERSIAVASFNYHYRFFSERMKIQEAGGDWVNTACAGFGLERLMYAFLCQFGLDPTGWPEPVRARVLTSGECDNV